MFKWKWTKRLQLLAEKKNLLDLEKEADLAEYPISTALRMDAVVKGIDLARKAGNRPLYLVVIKAEEYGRGPFEQLVFIGTEKQILKRIAKLRDVTVIRVPDLTDPKAARKFKSLHNCCMCHKPIPVPKPQDWKAIGGEHRCACGAICYRPLPNLTRKQAKLLLPLFKKIHETQQEWEKIGIERRSRAGVPQDPMEHGMTTPFSS